jgi:CBS domain-containing protein
MRGNVIPKKVRDIMVKNVITVEAGYTVKYAASLMSRFEVGCLIVMEDNEIVGMITETDILRRVVAVAKDPEETLIREIMSAPVFVVSPQVKLLDAVKQMVEHKVKKLPVVRKHPPEKGKLVGLVTLTDIARHQQEVIETMREAFKLGGETAPRSMEKVMNYYIV